MFRRHYRSVGSRGIRIPAFGQRYAADYESNRPLSAHERTGGNGFPDQGIFGKNDLMKTYFDQAPCLYFSTADDGTLIDVNETLCVKLGYAGEELLGQKVD